MVVRAFDREHALELVRHDADHVVRETFESAMVMARQTLKVIGVDDGEADLLLEQVRSRDAERFALETAGGMFAGRALVLGNIEHIAPPRHDDEARKQG
jgi:glutathione-regulated potassium-efflux system ancillary protein KefC/glutathione-regulated potassium-efflux system protein KefB